MGFLVFFVSSRPELFVLFPRSDTGVLKRSYAYSGHSFIRWKLDLLTFRVLLTRPKILYPVPFLASCSTSAAFSKQTKFGDG